MFLHLLKDGINAGKKGPPIWGMAPMGNWFTVMFEGGRKTKSSALDQYEFAMSKLN